MQIWVAIVFLSCSQPRKAKVSGSNKHKINIAGQQQSLNHNKSNNKERTITVFLSSAKSSSKKRDSGSALNFSADCSRRLKLQEGLSLISLFTIADDATTTPLLEPVSAGDTWHLSFSTMFRICRISPKINLEIFSTWGKDCSTDLCLLAFQKT